MGHEVALLNHAFARPKVEKPWQGGGRGPDVQLFFDPDDRSLWVFCPEDGRYRRVNNLVAISMSVRHEFVPAHRFGDLQPATVGHFETEIDLRARLIDRQT